MKKRIFAILLATVLSASMVACSSDKKQSSADIDWSKNVTLIDYRGLPKPTEEQIQADIDKLLVSGGKVKEVTGRAVENGDIANIDYEGKKDGVPFEGGTAQGYDLEIGSGTFIPGFEEGVIGVNIGETKDINLKFPEDYQSEDLAGQEVVFTVKVNSIKQADRDAFNDEFVKTATEGTYNTVDEFKTDNIKNLEATLDWQNIFENSQVEFPKGYLEQEEKSLKEQYEKSAKDNNVSLEDYLKQGYNMTLEQFEEQIKFQAENKAKQSAVVRAIAQAENIEISEEEYKEKAETYAQTAGFESVKELEKAYSRAYVEEIILFEKIEAILVE